MTDNDDLLRADARHAMIETQLDREDLACAGLRRVDDDGWPRSDLGEALAKPPTPKRRERKPTLESQLRQVWKAAQAAGVPVTVSIEGAAGKVTVSPRPANTAAAPDSDLNEWDRDLGTHPPEVRQ